MTFETARLHQALTNFEILFVSASVSAIHDVSPARTASARGASAADLADGANPGLAASSSPFSSGARLLDLRYQSSAPRILRREVCEHLGVGPRAPESLLL